MVCFHRCLSVHRRNGRCTPPGPTPLRQTPSSRWLLQQMVRILLECILVFLVVLFKDYITLVVGYLDEEVQMAVCFIWVELYGAVTSCNLPEKLADQLSHYMLHILITMRCTKLLLKALGNCYYHLQQYL